MTATATMPAAAFTAAPMLDADEAGLPTWLYRSEAFAEDLLGGDDAMAAPSAVSRPVPALLYGATLAAALIALWPAAGLVA
ncbi:hypothetical protein [Aquabacterium humicola]|uniref:hypothetical protein n=1 Tax=Aquabacterium humicola TaxID=3237377 RepID=UPI002542D4AF|nr:hypothetical protein [Rubrivivax pictus]